MFTTLLLIISLNATDTIPGYLKFSFAPTRPSTHMRRASHYYSYEDSTGNNITVYDSTRVVIKGDTAKLLHDMFKFWDSTINRPPATLQIKYYRKGKLIKKDGGGKGYTIYGKVISSLPFTVLGSSIKTDSILISIVTK